MNGMAQCWLSTMLHPHHDANASNACSEGTGALITLRSFDLLSFGTCVAAAEFEIYSWHVFQAAVGRQVAFFDRQRRKFGQYFAASKDIYLGDRG